METPISAVAEAVRHFATDPAKVHPSRDELRTFVEAELFTAGSLAPPPVVMARAIQRIREWTLAEQRSDQPIVARFRQAVATEHNRFVEDPTSALTNDCNDFQAALARCFGIEEHQVPALLTAFASMSNAERTGVFLHVERSPILSYLSAQIDNAPEDTPFEDPEGSFRKLMRLIRET